MTRNCARCDIPFAVTRPHARFCSARCRVAANRDSRNKDGVTQSAPAANVVLLRARRAEAVVTRPADVGTVDIGPLTVQPRCPGCHWRAAQPVPAGEITQCEACGLGYLAEDGQ